MELYCDKTEIHETNESKTHFNLRPIDRNVTDSCENDDEGHGRERV